MFKFIKILKIVFISFLLLLISSAFYIWNILNSPPTQRSFLESFRVQRILQSYDIKYNDNISNSSYIQLCGQYRKDLKDYYKDDLSDDVQEKIWQNYKEAYTLQVNIEKIFMNEVKPFKIVDTTIEYRYMPTFISTLKIKGYLQTLSNDKRGAVIPVNFDEKPKKIFTTKDYGFALSITLPYFNNSIPINSNDKNHLESIHKYMDKTYELLRENRKYTSIVKLTLRGL